MSFLDWIEEGYELLNWFTQVIVSSTERNDQMKGR